ncbi:MAG: type II secretion system secretin GspD [Proteobacteria bacterium]|nr:type II secretion system secretin GspD [Pseudomonadota bacterium]
MYIKPSIILVSLLTAALAGCATMGADREFSRDMAPATASPSHIPADTVNDEAPIKIDTDDKSHQAAEAKIEPGTGQFINEQVAREPVNGKTAPEGQITFNFENQPIQAVVQAILGALLHENYTIAPNVTGNVTFSTSKPITPEQAMPILQMLLGWTNNALVFKEGRYAVVPVKDAIPGNLTPRIAPAVIAKGYEVRAYPLRYIAATQMQKLLKPYAKADAVVSADDARNLLVMAGTAAELANYQRTIDIFDVDWLKGMSVGVYGLRNMDVSKIMPELDKIFGATGESPLAGMFRFIPMETTNSVVVITPQKDYLEKAESWLYKLDQGVGENGTQLYVYDVKNVKAADLSDHLNAIFTGQVSQRSSNTGNVAPGMRPVSIGQFNQGAGGVNRGGMNNTAMNMTEQRGRNTASNLTTTGTGTPASSGNKQTDIRITPIEENNQLLVMATPGEWDSIRAAIHRLDIAPLQVQIEAKILEVTLTGNLQYGVQWWLSGLINNSNAGSGTGFQYGDGYQGNPADRHRASLGGGAPTSLNGGSPGVFYSFLNKNFQVALSALEKSGNSKILSSPSLVVMNNQQAQLTVGTQVSVISASLIGLGGYNSTNTGTGITSTGVGQANYISTGVTLMITPRVNPGGLVYMDVSQQDTSPDYSTVTANNPNPAINQRNLDTQVAVQSGQTVLLGGMIQDQDGDSRNGVPGLSDIPVIGHLFGSTTRTRQRTELIVLITPRVITSTDEAQQMTSEYESKFESLAPLRAAQAAGQAAPAPAPPPVPVQTQPLLPAQPQAVPPSPAPSPSKENPQGEK